MKVTISLDFEALKEEIADDYASRLDDLKYSEDEIDRLRASFMENIDSGFMDATFEIETDLEETEVTSCILIGS